MVRTGYAGLGIGVVLLLIAISSASIVLGVLGLIILIVSGWATRALRSL
jgi:hypothetical protein